MSSLSPPLPQNSLSLTLSPASVTRVLELRCHPYFWVRLCGVWRTSGPSASCLWVFPRSVGVSTGLALPLTLGAAIQLLGDAVLTQQHYATGAACEVPCSARSRSSAFLQRCRGPTTTPWGTWQSSLTLLLAWGQRPLPSPVAVTELSWPPDSDQGPQRLAEDPGAGGDASEGDNQHQPASTWPLLLS